MDIKATGFSNHTIGSRELGWSTIVDANGDGIKDMVVPDARRRTLRVVSFANGHFQELARIRIKHKLSSAIVANDFNEDGRQEVIYGLQDERIYVLQFTN